MSSLMFDYTEPSVTTSSRKKDFFHMSSVWSDYTELFVTTFSHGKQNMLRYFT